MLNEKIRNLRKANNMTQEELAEKICVSRQAITKWETGLGIPDISNLESLAKLFNISLDQLVSEEQSINMENISRTEFDIFGKSDFDLDIGTARDLDVTTADIEKVIVEIRSDLPKEAYKLAKVKLTDGKQVDLVVVEYGDRKKHLDVKTDKDLSRQEAKEHLSVKVILPSELSNRIELEGNVRNLSIHDITQDHHIEFNGKADNASLRNLNGHLELTSNVDMEVFYDGSLRQLDINQIRCITNLHIPEKAELDIQSKGRASHVISDGWENKPEAEHKVELNGFKSEMTIRTKG